MTKKKKKEKELQLMEDLLGFGGMESQRESMSELPSSKL
jgi:hypothetical protein